MWARAGGNVTRTFRLNRLVSNNELSLRIRKINNLRNGMIRTTILVNMGLEIWLAEGIERRVGDRRVVEGRERTRGERNLGKNTGNVGRTSS